MIQRFICCAVFALAITCTVHADATSDAIATIKSVKTEGATNQEVGAAWKNLVGQGIDALYPTLNAFEGADPVALNWLQAAVFAIVEAERTAKRPLDTATMTKYVTNLKNPSAGRRIAYEILVELNPTSKIELLPGMVDDPNNDLRIDAIDFELARLEKSAKVATKEQYMKLFEATRTMDQATKIQTKIDKAFQVKPSLTDHFGVITTWKVVGPFDSTKGAGFEKVYSPEEGVNLQAKYMGKAGEVSWITTTTDHAEGLVDLNKVLTKHKDAAAYAYAVVESTEEMTVQIRIGSICAVKAFVNGKEVFANEEYHHGQRFDQYFGKVQLKKGKNEVLLKICQNNQTESWAQNWNFQARLSDFNGAKLPQLTNVDLK